MKHPKDKAERASFINTAAILCCLVVFGILAVVLPKPVYSNHERRDLTPKPEYSVGNLMSGEYTRELSAHYADTFPSRERFVQAAAVIQESAGIRYGGLRLHQAGPDVADDDLVIDLDPDPIEPLPDEEGDGLTLPKAPGADAEDKAPERAGAIIVYGGKGYQLFGGTEAMGSSYARVVSSYQQALGDSVQVYNLVIPSAIAFGLPDQYQNMTTPEHPRIEHIYSELDDQVVAVDVYDTFEAHKGEYLFFGTDHHWTVYGAYLAYSDFIRAAGMEPISIDDMEKRTLDYDFYGTYYSQTQDSELRRYPDTVDYFRIDTPHTALYYDRGSPYYGRQMTLLAEYAQGVNGYSVFLHGDFPLIKVTTENKNGRKIAVVKESFGNAFAPFLVNHYEEVYIVDERYIETGLVQLIRDNDIGELLFINNIFAAHTAYHINRLSAIMYQVYVPPVYVAPEPDPEPDVADPSDEQEGVMPGADDFDTAEAGEAVEVSAGPGEDSGPAPPVAAPEPPQPTVDEGEDNQ